MGANGTCTQIVRFSVRHAAAEVSDGGRVQPLDTGHAEVWNADRCCVGYLTKADYAKYVAASTSTASKEKE